MPFLQVKILIYYIQFDTEFVTICGALKDLKVGFLLLLPKELAQTELESPVDISRF